MEGWIESVSVQKSFQVQRANKRVRTSLQSDSRDTIEIVNGCPSSSQGRGRVVFQGKHAGWHGGAGGGWLQRD